MPRISLIGSNYGKIHWSNAWSCTNPWLFAVQCSRLQSCLSSGGHVKSAPEPVNVSSEHPMPCVRAWGRWQYVLMLLLSQRTIIAGMLTEQNAAKLSNRARNANVHTRWMVELKHLPDREHPAGLMGLVVSIPPLSKMYSLAYT